MARFLGLFAASILLLVGVPSAHALLPPIDDTVHLFSQAAREEGEQIIRETYEQSPTHRRIVVQTLPTLPAEQPDLQQYAETLFRNERLNGILIVITRDPHKLEITFGKQTTRLFPDKDELRQTILTHFKRGSFDQGLLDGLRYASARLMSSPPIAVHQIPPRSVSPMTRVNPIAGLGIGGILLTVLVVLFLVRLVGGLFRGAAGGMGTAMPGMGGGFFSSLVGSIFGVAAGSWLYDRFLGGGNAYGGSSDSQFYPTPDSSDTYTADDGDVGSSSVDSWNDGGSFDDGSSGGAGGDW